MNRDNGDDKGLLGIIKHDWDVFGFLGMTRDDWDEYG